MNIKNLNTFANSNISNSKYLSTPNKAPVFNKNSNTLKLKALNSDTVNFTARLNTEAQEITFSLDEIKALLGKNSSIKTRNLMQLPLSLEDICDEVYKEPMSGKLVVKGDLNFAKLNANLGCEFDSESIMQILKNVEKIEGKLVVGGAENLSLPDLKEVDKLIAPECKNLNLQNLKTANKIEIDNCEIVNLSSLKYVKKLSMCLCRKIKIGNLETADKITAIHAKDIEFGKLEKAIKIDVGFAENISFPTLTGVTKCDVYSSKNVSMKNLKNAGKIYAPMSENFDISSLKEAYSANFDGAENLKIPAKTKRKLTLQKFLELISLDE